MATCSEMSDDIVNSMTDVFVKNFFRFFEKMGIDTSSSVEFGVTLRKLIRERILFGVDFLSEYGATAFDWIDKDIPFSESSADERSLQVKVSVEIKGAIGTTTKNGKIEFSMNLLSDSEDSENYIMELSAVAYKDGKQKKASLLKIPLSNKNTMTPVSRQIKINAKL